MAILLLLLLRPMETYLPCRPCSKMDTTHFYATFKAKQLFTVPHIMVNWRVSNTYFNTHPSDFAKQTEITIQVYICVA